MADSIYRDYIPEGQDEDGLGSGYTDFVPRKEPVRVSEEVERDNTYACSQCDFVGTSRMSLLGHSRKHK